MAYSSRSPFSLPPACCTRLRRVYFPRGQWEDEPKVGEARSPSYPPGYAGLSRWDDSAGGVNVPRSCHQTTSGRRFTSNNACDGHAYAACADPHGGRSASRQIIFSSRTDVSGWFGCLFLKAPAGYGARRDNRSGRTSRLISPNIVQLSGKPSWLRYL